MLLLQSNPVRHFTRWLCAGVTALSAFACGTENSAESTTGMVTLDLASAPVDARCLQLTIVQGATTTTKKVPVGPNEPAAFVASGLPVGSVTLSEQVFTQACASATTAKWISDAQTVTLTAGQTLSLTFQLRLATATSGTVNVRSDFPDPLAGFTRLVTIGGGAASHLVLGPDDSFWYVTSSPGSQGLAKVNYTTGAITNVATLTSSTYSMTFGPDGRLWLGGGAEVVRLDPKLPAIKESFPTFASALARSIVSGPDGNLWFTLDGPNAIGRMTLKGVYTQFPLLTASPSLDSICVGPDGNLWFLEISANKIGKITTAGVVTEYAVPTAGAGLRRLVPGPDGNLWFTESVGNKIGRITTAGVITEFPLPVAGEQPSGIGRGPDGNLWFGRGLGLGRITPTGTISAFDGFAETVAYISTGPDGRLYFTYSDYPYGGVARIHPNQL